MRYCKAFCLLLVLLSSFRSEAQELGKNYLKGLKGTDSLSIKRVWTGSLVLPGYGQAYNRQYWKIPVVYGTAAAFLYGGARSHSNYKETGLNKYLDQSRLYYMGAGLVYLGSVLDALNNYRSDKEVIPTKATLLSMMLPGMGQAYNGDYWKIPVIYTGFAFLGYWYDLNQMQYTRFRKAFNLQYMHEMDSSNPPSEFNGRLTSSGIKSYRDNFRRNRDYAFIYLILWYGLNMVDANVFAHLSTFDVSEDLAFKLTPTVIPEFSPNPNFAIGLSLKMKITK